VGRSLVAPLGTRWAKPGGDNIFGGKHRATHLWVVAIAVVVGYLAFAATSGAATTSGKSKTKVSVEFDRGGTLEDNGYKVTVKKPKNCKRDRKVTVFHDENERQARQG